MGYLLYSAAFVLLFAFRYVRVIMNIIYSRKYRPTPTPANPSYHGSDLTVIICTTQLMTPTFIDVITSILTHDVHSIMISTAGYMAPDEEAAFKERFPDQRIAIFWQEKPSRRKQTDAVLCKVTTPLIVITDDHTRWPQNERFLPAVLAPFENPKIGAVTPAVEVIRHDHNMLTFAGFWAGFWNFLGCLWLERRHHEYKATNTIEGSITCVASRFAVFRSEIYCSPEFRKAYVNELVPTFSWSTLSWNMNGNGIPLEHGDDKYHTRFLDNHGWDAALQAGPDSTMKTELGVFAKFPNQALRWARSSYASNPRVLFFDHEACRRHPYLTYSTVMYNLVRFPLFYEAALLALARLALIELGLAAWFWPYGCSVLLTFIISMKLMKIWPHFQKNGYRDLVYFPGYILFGWVYSFVRVYAAWTRLDNSWDVVVGAKKTEKTPDDQSTPLLNNCNKNLDKLR